MFNDTEKSLEQLKFLSYAPFLHGRGVAHIVLPFLSFIPHYFLIILITYPPRPPLKKKVVLEEM